ncbi:MAG: HAMP domain-containing histidine kinase [Sulfuritalea sp.]|jgi:signal transduction histidine kinase|nr:HAMP domain-containing histidine kinase [Sulfuritalea sp.]
MRRRHSLRFRVAATLAGMGAFLSLVFAVGVWFAAHDVSQRLMDQTLKAELDDYMARRARNPRSLPPDTATLRGYVTVAGAGSPEIPAAIRDLTPGKHAITIDGAPFRVSVADQPGSSDRYYILFNEERQQRREQRFLGYLVVGALLMTLLVAAGGFWLAGRVIAPLTELARAVGQAPAENPPRLSAVNSPQDEISELTRAFDRYMSRLSAFIERERTFAADASHELRTPLAVIRGASEVLAEDASLSEAQAKRIARIERAATEMSALIAALLLLAREEDTATDESCDCELLVRQAVERYRTPAAQRGNSIELAIEAAIKLEVAPALLSIVVGNLVRNAVSHTEGGSVTVRLCADRLIVSDTGIGISNEEIGRVFQRYYRGASSAGAGIGLSLVKRICDRQHWEIALESRAGGGTTATLRFT